MKPCHRSASKAAGVSAFTLDDGDDHPVDVIGQGRNNRCVIPWLLSSYSSWDNSYHAVELARIKKLISTFPNRGLYWVRDFRDVTAQMTPLESPAWWVIKGMSDKNTVALKLLW